ncbi:MAG: DUF2189 domain-containing protein [Alphaproteobacteria bacterium]|jgi:uncharacterized membrane protein|nr:DUF2189 domain-containing protein [Alphaproteobacteria bacterium]
MSDVPHTDTGSETEPSVLALPRQPAIRQLDMEQPWQWLAAGWRDLRAAPSASLPYGLVFAVIGIVLTILITVYDVFYVALPIAAGFMLVGPIAAVGLYDISRRLAAGKEPTLGNALGAWRVNTSQVAFFGVVLLVINLAWVRLAFLIFMLFFSGRPPRPEVEGLIDVFFQPSSIAFLATGTAVGAVLAALTFAISAVSIPMLLDRPNTNVIQAMATSFEAVRQNPGPMFLWAWLIVLFIAAGIAIGFIGLIITLPLIGHATWAAYKAVVVWPEDDEQAAA